MLLVFRSCVASQVISPTSGQYMDESLKHYFLLTSQLVQRDWWTCFSSPPNSCPGWVARQGPIVWKAWSRAGSITVGGSQVAQDRLPVCYQGCWSEGCCTWFSGGELGAAQTWSPGALGVAAILRCFHCCFLSTVITPSFKTFYWSIVALKCCVSFYSVTRVHISSLFWISFPFRSHRALSSLC